MSRLLIKSKFKNWLENNRMFFKTKSPRHCPIAEYLNHTTGRTWFVSTDDACTCEPEDIKRINLPLWAQDFIEKIDGLSECSSTINSNLVLKLWLGKR